MELSRVEDGGGSGVDDVGGVATSDLLQAMTNYGTLGPTRNVSATRGLSNLQ